MRGSKLRQKWVKNGKKKFSKKNPRLEFFRDGFCKISYIKIVLYIYDIYILFYSILIALLTMLFPYIPIFYYF
jgi:hypothetical protein